MHNEIIRSVENKFGPGLIRLADLVAARMGLQFPDSRRADLVRGAQMLARERGENTQAFLQSLAAAPLTDRQIEVLTAHLTVGETYFFRERDSLNAFQNHVIPELIRQRAGGDQRLRIWSAGCSTGEEAYSIAMLLAETIPNLDTWNIHILATDINPQSIKKARQGAYTEWSFRGTPKSLRDKCFTPQGPKTFAVRPKFRNMVSFECLNLATDIYPSLENRTNAMDVIFCRNVMMYFVPELIQKVIRHFRDCLMEGGWLIVAPCETSLPLTSAFASVPFERATLYRKDSQKPPAASIWTHTVPIPAERTVEAKKAIPPLPERITPAIKPIPSVTAPVERQIPPYEEALAAYRAGRFAEAAAALQALFGTDQPEGTELGDAFALMARIYADQGKLDLAADWARKAIAADKINPGFYYLLATIAEEQNLPADAEQALRRALYLNPAYILAHFSLGNIAIREKKHQDADRHFQNAVALLTKMPKDEVLPESEGVTAGRLLEIIETMSAKEVLV